MSDTPDKILLKVGVDAADVAKGVDEVKAGMAEMNAAVEAGNAAQRKVSAELKTQDLTLTAPAGTSGALASENAALSELAAREATAADAAIRLDEGSKGLGTSVDELSRNQMADLTRILGLVSPELQMAGMEAMHLKAGISALAAVTGVGVGAMVGAIGIVAAFALSFKEITKAVGEATAKLDAFYAAQERIRAGEQGKEKDVGKAIAKGGLPLEALGGARSMVNRLVGMGADRQTAVNSVQNLVDETGKPLLSDQDAFLLVSGIEAGSVKPMKGTTPAQRERSLERGRAQAARSPVAVRMAEENAYAEQRRRDALASGDEAAIKQDLMESEGLSDLEATKRAKTIVQQTKGLKPAGIPLHGQKVARPAGTDWSNEPEFTLDRDAKVGEYAREAQVAARQLGAIRQIDKPRPAQEPPSTAAATPAQEPMPVTMTKGRGLSPEYDPFYTPPGYPPATADSWPRPKEPPAPAAAPTVNTYNVTYQSNYHGPTYAGTQADVNRRVVRMQ